MGLSTDRFAPVPFDVLRASPVEYSGPQAVASLSTKIPEGSKLYCSQCSKNYLF